MHGNPQLALIQGDRWKPAATCALHGPPSSVAARPTLPSVIITKAEPQTAPAHLAQRDHLVVQLVQRVHVKAQQPARGRGQRGAEGQLRARVGVHLGSRVQAASTHTPCLEQPQTCMPPAPTWRAGRRAPLARARSRPGPPRCPPRPEGSSPAYRGGVGGEVGATAWGALRRPGRHSPACAEAGAA